jgi:hypothetical protein
MSGIGRGGTGRREHGGHRRRWGERRSVQLGAALLGAALLGGTAGCGGIGTDESPSGASSSVALGPDVLLTADQAPEWNGAMGWVETDLPGDTGALSVCDLPTAESLGATEVLERDFLAAGVPEPDTTPDPTWPASYATNVVALFPDSATASSAVEAWAGAVGDCSPGPSTTGAVQSVQIGTLATGSTWSAAAPDDACPECLRFDFAGFAAKGSAATIVGFSLSGQDANYEGDPLAESIAASLARLP